jgi:hypothetical protein
MARLQVGYIVKHYALIDTERDYGIYPERYYKYTEQEIERGAVCKLPQI